MRAVLAAIRCEKGDVGGNLAAHLRLLASAAAAGCDLALFPEMSLTGSGDPATHPERLIPLDHPAVAELARATGETGVGACFGVAERSPAAEPHITQVFAAGGLVRPDGSVAARLPDWREGVLTADIPLSGRQPELHPGELLR